MVEEQQKSDKKAAPTVRSMAVDQNEKVERAVTEMVVDEPGEDLNTMLKVEDTCMGRRLPSGLLFRLLIDAAACELIGATAVLLTATQQPRAPFSICVGLTRLYRGRQVPRHFR